MTIRKVIYFEFIHGGWLIDGAWEYKMSLGIWREKTYEPDESAKRKERRCFLAVCWFLPVALKAFSSLMTASDAKTCIASQSRLPGLPPMAKYLNPFRTFSLRSGRIRGTAGLPRISWIAYFGFFTSPSKLSRWGHFVFKWQASDLTGSVSFPRGKSILVSANILRLLVWRRPGTLSWPRVSKFDLRSCIKKNAISGDPRGVLLPLCPDFIISGHSHGNWGPSGKRTASQRVARGAGFTVEVLDSRYSGAAYGLLLSILLDRSNETKLTKLD